MYREEYYLSSDEPRQKGEKPDERSWRGMPAGKTA
jgi:hypothetical protein